MASNAKSGEKIFRTKCAQCHATARDHRAGAAHKQVVVDTNLNELFGRQSGATPGYSYSAVGNNMAVTCGESALSDCLLNPKKCTRMEPQERKDLIGYLREHKNTSHMISSQPCISKANIFQIQRCIPISWRKPTLRTYRDLPIGEKQKGTPEVPKDDTVPLLIDSIRTLSTQYQLSKAFKSFSLLQLHSPSPDLFLHPISSLLSASTTLKALPQGKQLHSQAISLGLADNPFIVSRLCSLYSKVGLIYDAKTIVEGSNPVHVLPWNLLLSAYLQNCFWLDAVLAYKKMIERGCDVDKFTCSSVLKACGEICNLGLGRVVHGSIETRGLELDLYVSNALISMYAKFGEMDVARKLFDRMQAKDVVTWNCMISGYSSEGMWKETSELLEKMQLEGSEMNTVTWNTIATANSQMGSHLEALKLICKMRMRGISVDSVTLVIGLNSCSSSGYLHLGKEIHGLAVRLHYNEFENVRNALITMYSRCEKIEDAYNLFGMCFDKSLITWNAMIAGFAVGKYEEETFFLFREMVNSGTRPNNVTIMTVLSLCARFANLWYGRQLHCFVTKHRFDNDQFLWNSLIHMYSKSQRLLVAQRVFNMMGNQDLVSYTSMIAGYGMQGEGRKALKLFNEMIVRGIKPDGITMLTILSACRHAGLVSQGQRLFKKMVSLYGIVPNMEHYYMAELYGEQVC